MLVFADRLLQGVPVRAARCSVLASSAASRNAVLPPCAPVGGIACTASPISVTADAGQSFGRVAADSCVEMV
jgi:hypothetical protein